MTAEVLTTRPGSSGGKAAEYRAIALVSSAHFVNHFQGLVLPPLFSLLAVKFGVGFVELGLALTVASVTAVASQLPIGFLVDRLGSRRMLIAGLIVAGLAYLGFGLHPSYPTLLVAMVFVGLSNSVFHPADYSLLTAKIPAARLGRAFSIHTFSGFLGNALAPMVMLGFVASIGLNSALLVPGILALAVAVPLILARGVEDYRVRMPAAKPAAGERRDGLFSILTPTILGLTGFFSLMSLSGSGISNFSVVALTHGFGTSLSVANLALTAYLSFQAFGVLVGGFVADLTRRHGEVASIGYAINACIVLAIGTSGFAPLPLIVAMSCAGLLSGMIMPSRDMLVRAAAPAGAIGRTFGIVTSGFGVGGMVGPLMFGFAMDHGAPRWVFGISVILMIAVAVVALVSDRRTEAKRRQHSVAVTASAD